MVNLRICSLSILSSCTTEHDLPGFRLAHAVHSDVKPTLVFFNNCRLTNVSLSQFENKHFEMVARCFTNDKTQKSFRNNRFLHSNSQRFFANVSLEFSISNNRRVTFLILKI